MINNPPQHPGTHPVENKRLTSNQLLEKAHNDSALVLKELNSQPAECVNDMEQPFLEFSVE